MHDFTGLFSAAVCMHAIYVCEVLPCVGLVFMIAVLAQDLGFQYCTKYMLDFYRRSLFDKSPCLTNRLAVYSSEPLIKPYLPTGFHYVRVVS